MALSTQVSVLAKRRASNWVSGFGRAFSKIVLDRFWSWQAQFLGNIDLQVVEFGALDNTDVVIANAACTLYAVVILKPTAVLSVWKGTNNASTGSTNGAQDFSISQNKIGEQVFLCGAGHTLSSGLTIRASTTATGATPPNTADKPSGICIIGA
jgi:hypothetical protein